MMDGSSLRIIVGTYSALGTLEEISWQEEVEQEEDEGVCIAQKQSKNECRQQSSARSEGGARLSITIKMMLHTSVISSHIIYNVIYLYYIHIYIHTHILSSE